MTNCYCQKYVDNNEQDKLYDNCINASVLNSLSGCVKKMQISTKAKQRRVSPAVLVYHWYGYVE